MSGFNYTKKLKGNDGLSFYWSKYNKRIPLIYILFNNKNLKHQKIKIKIKIFKLLKYGY